MINYFDLSLYSLDDRYASVEPSKKAISSTGLYTFQEKKFSKQTAVTSVFYLHLQALRYPYFQQHQHQDAGNGTLIGNSIYADAKYRGQRSVSEPRGRVIYFTTKIIWTFLYDLLTLGSIIYFSEGRSLSRYKQSFFI